MPEKVQGSSVLKLAYIYEYIEKAESFLLRFTVIVFCYVLCFFTSAIGTEL